MTHFSDGRGDKWNVELDAYVLKQLREEFKFEQIDQLLFRLETNEDELFTALTIICEIDDAREFARGLRGNSITRAREAVRGAAANFFPPSKWSEIHSRFKRRQEAEAALDEIRPLMAMLKGEDVPVAIREAVMTAIAEKIEGMSIDLKTSEADSSAPGQDSVPKNAASDSPDSSELAPEV